MVGPSVAAAPERAALGMAVGAGLGALAAGPPGAGDAAPLPIGAGPLGSHLQPGEEIWVIARQKPSPANRAAPGDDQHPGSGAMVATLPNQTETVPVPLKHTAVAASVTGYVAGVTVTQQFHNPYDGKIEAKYVFPLPQNAAVNGFVMTVGERKIRGVIREREEAQRIYQAARRAGHVASLMTQERPNIFTQNVANIEPGKQIDVTITYFNTLTYADGWYEFVFPMVVGPRYNPPHQADGIGAVAQGGQPGRSGQTTEVSYLRPNQRSGHDISVSMTIDAGVAIEQVHCPTHSVHTTTTAPARATVALAPNDVIPNRDLVVRYRVAGAAPKAGMLVQQDPRNPNAGYFTLMVYPPNDPGSAPRQPMEMVFVLDCSGSMSGAPLTQAKDAVRYALGQLDPGDTFQIIRFSNDASQLGDRPLPATPANLDRGLAYLDELQGGGGTRMVQGVKAALDFPQDPERLRVVTFMTDGFIGNEKEILTAVAKRVQHSRVFSFGVGSSVNRFLIERMAKLGRGTVAYLLPSDDGAAVMGHYLSRVSKPALRDVQVEMVGGARMTGVFPKRMPDVFAGRPMIVTGRYTGSAPSGAIIRGRLGAQPTSMQVSAAAAPMMLAPSQAGRAMAQQPVPPLAAVWARMRIADLNDQMVMVSDAHGELAGEIKRTALNFSLMSAYTSFVAVDTFRRTAGDHGTTVPVPVPVPPGTRYDNTVNE